MLGDQKEELKQLRVGSFSKNSDDESMSNQSELNDQIDPLDSTQQAFNNSKKDQEEQKQPKVLRHSTTDPIRTLNSKLMEIAKCTEPRKSLPLFTSQGDVSQMSNQAQANFLDAIKNQSKVPNLKSATIAEMEKQHEEHELKTNQCKTSKDFMKMVMYSVPLNKLYRIMASCQFNEGADFCPVLVEIVDKTIIKITNGTRYLLQVWSKKGDMIFERQLDQPVCNWNISGDKFIFQERNDQAIIYVVRLFLDEPPVLFKFSLPNHVCQNRMGSYFNKKTQRFVVPDENTGIRRQERSSTEDHNQVPVEFGQVDTNRTLIKNEAQKNTKEAPSGQTTPETRQNQPPPRRRRGTVFRLDEVQKLRDFGELRSEYDNKLEPQPQSKDNQTRPQKYEMPKKSVNQIMRDDLIVRTPDKMIDYLDGFIMFAFRDSLVYFRVSQFGVQDINESKQYADNDNPRFIQRMIDEENLCYLQLDKDYKIICIQEIGNEMATLVLEDMQMRQIRFLQCSYDDGKVTTNGQAQRQLKLVQLGVKVNEPLSISKLLKYRAVVKIDPLTEKQYHVGVVLRENGRFEVYSDFMLVSEYLNPQLQCVDIETDFNQFFLKFVKKADEVTKQTPKKDLQFEIRQVRHFWRNRISFNTSAVKNDGVETWNHVLHHRIAGFCRLYTQILNFSMHMLVSHRNMISVFDMSKGLAAKSEWIDTVHFNQGNIRQMFIKKRSKQERHDKIIQQVTDKDAELKKVYKKSKELLSVFKKYKIVCFLGINSIQMVYLNGRGMIKRINQRSMDSQMSERSAESNLTNSQRDNKLMAPLAEECEDLDLNSRIISFQNDDQYNNGVLFLTEDNLDEQLTEYLETDGCSLYNFPFNVSKETESFLPDLSGKSSEKKAKSLTLNVLKHGKVHKLLSSLEEKCVSYDSYFKVMQTNRASFSSRQRLKKSNGTMSFVIEDSSDDDDIRQSLNYSCQKGQDVRPNSRLNIVLCMSYRNGASKIYPLVKERNKQAGIERMHLIKERHKSFDVNTNDADKPETIINHTFYVNSSEFGEYNDTFCQISEESIKIYDRSLQQRLVFEGLNVRSCRDLHQAYLYTINDRVIKPHIITDLTRDDGLKKEPSFRYKPSGLYVVDMQKLLEGEVESYRLASAIGGVCNFIDVSKFSNRISFIMDYDKIAVIPFPHLNLINCVGMRQKHEYLIWREKNGFFTALDRRSNLQTWSLVTGKLLYSEEQHGDAHEKQIEKYEVYRSEDNDITYTQKLYNLEDCSITLLKQRKPVDNSHSLMKGLKSLNERQLQRAFEKQKTLNQSNMVGLGDNEPRLKKNLFVSDHDISIKILNSQQQSELFHFKVMQLRVHEDTKGFSECSVRFHFLFPLIKAKYRDKLRKFDWDINSAPVQRLWLSRDTKRLMEVINDFIGTVYVRVNLNEDGQNEQDDQDQHEDNGQAVRWKVEYYIKRFPKSLVDKTSVPYLFSPNFKYQLDFNYRGKFFLIRETQNQNTYLEIPRDLVNMQEWDNAEGQGAIQIILSRISWQSEKRLKIINESNIECLFDIETTDPKDEQPSARYLKLISSVKIDNGYENMRERNSPHMIMEPVALEARDVLERLIRMNQDYKISLQHAINLGQTDFNILSKINKIDYLQKWSDPYSSFDVECSFTWLDWRILELIVSDEIFNVENVDTEQALQLCFNIWPRGRGVLHQLVLGGQIEQQYENLSGDQIKAYWTAQDLFKIAHQRHKMDLTGDNYFEEGIPFEIPILPDMYGATPLEMCLGINKHSFAEEEKVYFFKERKAEQLSRSQNQAMADIIFKNIKEYGYMHSSSNIHEAIIEAVRQSLPSIGEYLESRMIKPTHCFQSSTQHQIKAQALKHTESMGNYGFLKAQVWVGEKWIKENMFDTSGVLLPMYLLYIDIPYLYYSSTVGMEFIHALGQCNDYSLFNLCSVQIIIDNHNRYWRKINMLAIGLPIIIQLVTFWYWSNMLLPNLKIDADFGFQKQTDFCNVLLNLLSVYLLIMQIPQIYNLGWKYLFGFERLAGLVTPVLIFVNTYHQDLEEERFWTFQAWSALLVWLRFALYLRSYSVFGWYVRMIVQTVWDMKMFLLVFFIGVLAFADAFQSVNETLLLRGQGIYRVVPDDASDYEKYVADYIKAIYNSFLVALGDFTYRVRVQEMNDSEWMIFILCCIFNIIMLLNLLIAIISETYSRISLLSVQTSYKEKALYAGEMQKTFYGYRKAKLDHNERLFVAKVINSDQIQEDDTVSNQIEELKECIIDTIQDQVQSQREFTTSYIDQKLETLANALSKKFEEHDQGEDYQKEKMSLRHYMDEESGLQKAIKQKARMTLLKLQRMEHDGPLDAMAGFVTKTKKPQRQIDQKNKFGKQLTTKRKAINQ